MARRKRRKAVARRGPTRRRTARMRRPAGMSGAVKSLRAYRAELVAHRAGLDEQIAAVEQALAAMGGLLMAGRPRRPVVGRRAFAGRRRRAGRRAARPGSLKSYIADVMRGKDVIAVKDVTAAVLDAGYKTRNKTLAKSVGIALTEMKQVRKVGRGRFRMK
jgi:hypothetical protein